MSTHSAAPWVVDGPPPAGRNPNMGLWCVEGAKNFVASDCTLADAHLIAAAPDMLSVLKTIDARWSEAFPGGPDNDGSVRGRFGSMADWTLPIWREVRAAIALATPSDTHEVG